MKEACEKEVSFIPFNLAMNRIEWKKIVFRSPKHSTELQKSEEKCFAYSG